MNEKLWLAIRRSGLHQYQIAARAGISENTLSRILLGRNSPSFVVKKRLAQVLGLSVQELFDEAEAATH